MCGLTLFTKEEKSNYKKVCRNIKDVGIETIRGDSSNDHTSTILTKNYSDFAKKPKEFWAICKFSIERKVNEKTKLKPMFEHIQKPNTLQSLYSKDEILRRKLMFLKILL